MKISCNSKMHFLRILAFILQHISPYRNLRVKAHKIRLSRARYIIKIQYECCRVFSTRSCHKSFKTK